MYTYDIDYGLSWRDCPFYIIYKDGVKVASGIGEHESAERAINKLIEADLK